MIKFSVFCVLVASLAVGQPVQDSMVAEVNGKPLTVSELQAALSGYSIQQRQVLLKQLDNFLRGYAMQLLLVEQAEKQKLDQETPYREQLAHARRNILANAMMNQYELQHEVTPQDQRKFYEANAGRYREAKVKLVYIPYGNKELQGGAGGKKLLTETEAKARAEIVVKQARGGADFVKLVKQYSEDPGSAANDGNLGTPVRATTQGVPDPVKKAVLAGKAGEITDPVRTDNGFYVFRVESVDQIAYDTVKDDIFKELKSAGLNRKIDEIKRQSSVKITNEAFFKNPSLE